MIGYRDRDEHLVDHLVRVSYALDRAAASGDPDLDRTIAAHDVRMREREAATSFALPIVGLAERFGLTDLELHLLIAAAVPGLDIGLADRWQRHCTSTDPERRVVELVDLFTFEHAGGTVVDTLAVDRVLRASRLVQLSSPREWTREAPLVQQKIGVPDRVIAALRGNPVFDPQLAAIATRIVGGPGVGSPILRELIASRSPVVVGGPALAGKTTAIVAAAADLGRCVIVVDLAVASALADGARWLDDVHADARLLDAVLVLRAADGLQAIPLPLQRGAIALANRGEAIVTARDPAPIVRSLRTPRVFHVEVPGVSAQAAMWRSHLGPSRADVESVVARCSLPAGEIAEAAAAAASAASRAERPISTDDLTAAARARLQHRLGDVAALVTTTLDWSDLVVREDVMHRITEIIAAVAHRERVLDTWGFGAKLPYGRSISALFSGPPGTGKTMIATLIAKELGLELFRIDLSKVVSKWLGETEKNLARVFDEAARVGAVLLFDEADSLFAKRTEVRSSNDRNANLEVNYLLQRLEQHDGIVLLTTNALNSIDEAFMRRLRFRIELAAPDVAEREALWRSMIPAQAPLARDIDLRAIAERFKMAGGYIKNAVVRAAFMAAARDEGAIEHSTLVQAATLEWIELGNLPG